MKLTTNLNTTKGEYQNHYYRQLKGTITDVEALPVTINVYLNNDLLSPIKFINNTEFIKDIYLSDGENIIKVEAIDADNNIATIVSKKILVNIMPTFTEEHPILTNFIASDDKHVRFNIDDIDAEYESKDAQYQKILLNTDVYSHFFNLVGENSEFYRISRDNLPNIQSQIIKKPVGISYDYVEKIYDGNNDFTKELAALKYKNGYDFTDVTDNYDNYLSTGFVKGITERLAMQSILFKQYDILPESITLNVNNLDYNSFELCIDETSIDELTDEEIIDTTLISTGLVKIEETNHEYYEVQFEKIEDVKYTKINSHDDFIDIYSSKSYNGLCYYIYAIENENMIQYIGTAIDGTNDDFKTYEIKSEILSKEDENVSESIELQLTNWLRAIDHIIHKVTLHKDEEGNNILKFHFVDNDSKYTVKDKITIKYNYKNKLTGENSITYVKTDEYTVGATFDSANVIDKSVTAEWRPINILGLQLTAGSNGDNSNNYQIHNYNAFGRIKKKNISLSITTSNKVYDGSIYMPYTYKLEGVIEGDDVTIDNEYAVNDGTVTNNYHTFKEIGTSTVMSSTPDVVFNSKNEVNAIIIDNKNIDIILEGIDINNYNLDSINISSNGAILKREITVVIDKVIYKRATKTYDFKYHFVNNIPTDNLSLIFPDKCVFAKSSPQRYGLEIISTFFDYSFNPNYQFISEDEIHTPENTNVSYWTNEARVAEPDTERIDINITSNSNYPGDILLEATDLPYFESSNKQYKLYNNDEVMVTGFKLDPENPKSKNYELNTTSYPTHIEII